MQTDNYSREYQPLRTVCGLFRQAQLDESRTCIFWNDEIDLPSDIVYEYGTKLVPAAAEEQRLAGA